MTKEQILTIILAEATGRPKREIRAIFQGIKATRPEARYGLEKRVPHAQAQRDLASLRSDKAAVTQWLTEGAFRAASKMQAANVTGVL